jgi:hypothetical protein
MSQLGGNASLQGWKDASLGCETETAFKKITPVPFPSWVVGIFAVCCVVCFLIQSITAKYPRFGQTHRGQVVLQALAILWSMLVVVAIFAMFLGLVFLWDQRNELKLVAAQDFQDNQWGFGQVAALFIWAPIPVEILYHINGKP